MPRDREGGREGAERPTFTATVDRRRKGGRDRWKKRRGEKCQAIFERRGKYSFCSNPKIGDFFGKRLKIVAWNNALILSSN